MPTRVYSAPMEHIDKAAGDFWISVGSPLLTNTAGRSIPTDAQLMLEYLTNDLVYTCANWNAAAVEEITDHPLLNLLEKDNDGLNGYQLRYMTGVYMEVFGGAYWLLEPGPFEPVRRIKVLPTQRVLPLRDNPEFRPINVIFGRENP
ncbi:MAG: hypothetical protein ACP5VQ_11410 [Phycisphaerae bacterium]